MLRLVQWFPTAGVTTPGNATEIFLEVPYISIKKVINVYFNTTFLALM